MGFKVIKGDITKVKEDVIINSVGVETTIYGSICKSILNAANSKKLKGIIDGANNCYTVGEYFITDGYALPSKHILHLITPHAKDDHNLKLLSESIRRAFNECQARGWKNVGIPSIGTIANVYDGLVVKNLICEMGEKYCSFYDMNITFVIYDNYDDSNLQSSRSKDPKAYHNEKTLKKFKKGAKEFQETFDDFQKIKYNKTYFNYEHFNTPQKEFSNKGLKAKNIGEYVDAFIASKIDVKHYIDSEFYYKRIYRNFGYGKKGKNNIIDSGKNDYSKIAFNISMDKKLFYRIIFALKMSFREAKDFLNYFGYEFSVAGVNAVDDTVRDLLFKHEFDTIEVDLELKNKCGNTIFK